MGEEGRAFSEAVRFCYLKHEQGIVMPVGEEGHAFSKAVKGGVDMQRGNEAVRLCYLKYVQWYSDACFM